MVKSMGLIPSFRLRPSPGAGIDISNDGIVRIDGDVLDRDLLLSGSAVAVEPFGEHQYRASGLVR
jgi:hypothetical protein